MDSEIFADSIAKKRVPGHWSLFSSAERYLKNVFKHDIFVNKYTNSYPYEPQKLSRWFSKEVSRGRGEQPVKIPFYNARDICEARSAIKKKEHECVITYDLECWFHGTNNESAVDIVNKGIDLKKGRKTLDFSNGGGFYLNPDGMSAVEWATSKKCASVIIFKVSREIRDDHKLLDLRGDEESWEKVVLWNRSGENQRERLDEELSEEFKLCDYLRGPMAGDNTKYTIFWRPQRINGSEQICVKTKRMAKVIGYPELNNILGVVSWNN